MSLSQNTFSSFQLHAALKSYLTAMIYHILTAVQQDSQQNISSSAFFTLKICHSKFLFLDWALVAKLKQWQSYNIFITLPVLNSLNPIWKLERREILHNHLIATETDLKSCNHMINVSLTYTHYVVMPWRQMPRTNKSKKRELKDNSFNAVCVFTCSFAMTLLSKIDIAYIFYIQVITVGYRFASQVRGDQLSHANPA